MGARGIAYPRTTSRPRPGARPRRPRSGCGSDPPAASACGAPVRPPAASERPPAPRPSGSTGRPGTAPGPRNLRAERPSAAAHGSPFSPQLPAPPRTHSPASSPRAAAAPAPSAAAACGRTPRSAPSRPRRGTAGCLPTGAARAVIRVRDPRDRDPRPPTPDPHLQQPAALSQQPTQAPRRRPELLRAAGAAEAEWPERSRHRCARRSPACRRAHARRCGPRWALRMRGGARAVATVTSDGAALR